MTRRMTDGLIILAVLALGATHLWAQGMGGRKTVHANQGDNNRVVRSNPVPNGGAVGGRHVAPNGVGNGVGVNAQALRGSAGPAGIGAAGPAPMGAAGPAPMGAAGPAAGTGGAGSLPAGCRNVAGGVVCGR